MGVWAVSESCNDSVFHNEMRCSPRMQPATPTECEVLLIVLPSAPARHRRLPIDLRCAQEQDMIKDPFNSPLITIVQLLLHLYFVCVFPLPSTSP
jgi:hypothetical protein